MDKNDELENGAPGLKERPNVVPLPPGIAPKEDYTCQLKFIGWPEKDISFSNEGLLKEERMLMLSCTKREARWKLITVEV